jgi:hypothetical protein
MTEPESESDKRHRVARASIEAAMRRAADAMGLSYRFDDGISGMIVEGAQHMANLHRETFAYLQPTPTQIHDMQTMRDAARTYADAIEAVMPEGPDKTYALRQLREVAMWVNIGITRHADGTPRA